MMLKRLRRAPRVAPGTARAVVPLVRQPRSTRCSVLPGLSQEVAALAARDSSTLTLLGVAAVNVGGVYLASRAVSAWQDRQPVTVVKVQLGLRTDNQERLQKDLIKLKDVLAGGAQGIWLAMEEAIAILSARQGEINYASVQSELVDSKDQGRKLFAQLAVTEAMKADSEELDAVQHEGSNLTRRAKRLGPLKRLFGAGGPSSAEACPVDDEIIVVTLLLVTRGALQVPSTVQAWPDVRQTLQQCTALTSDKIMGLEVLWTPNQPGDYLPASRFCEDYPEMVLLSSGQMVGVLQQAAASKAN